MNDTLTCIGHELPGLHICTPLCSDQGCGCQQSSEAEGRL